jgi:hypothetical protein
MDLSSAIKQFLDKRVYSKYADNQEIMEKVWNISSELTQVKV